MGQFFISQPRCSRDCPTSDEGRMGGFAAGAAIIHTTIYRFMPQQSSLRKKKIKNFKKGVDFI